MHLYVWDEALKPFISPVVLQLHTLNQPRVALLLLRHQVVCRCCQDAGSSSGPLEALMSKVKEGLLSQESLLRLLRTFQRDAPSSLPKALQPLLEEMEEKLRQDPSKRQKSGGRFLPDPTYTSSTCRRPRTTRQHSTVEATFCFFASVLVTSALFILQRGVNPLEPSTWNIRLCSTKLLFWQVKMSYRCIICIR